MYINYEAIAPSSILLKQLQLVSTFGMYFNTGDAESINQLLRSICRDDCSLVRLHAVSSPLDPINGSEIIVSSIDGIESLQMYALLTMEAVPDAIAEFEDVGINDQTIIFKFSISGMRVLDIELGNAADGESKIRRVFLRDANRERVVMPFNLNGLLNLEFDADGKLTRVACRML